MHLSVCQCQCCRPSTVRDIITKCLGHHPVVERVDKLKNGYVGVCRIADGDVLVLNH